MIIHMGIPWQTNIYSFSETKEKMIGIYKITEKNNPSMFYIGKSNNIERRFKEHIYKSYSQSRIPFDSYIAEKGSDSFTYEVLEECPIDKLNEREAYWIDKMQATNSGNVFKGGLSDVVGSHNPRAKLTEDDVIKIREAYNKHLSQKDVYKDFENKISFKYFQSVWQGRSWSHIMPEVFTEKNKNYYIYQNSIGEKSKTAKFSNEEVVQIRKRYVHETAKEIYEDYKDRVGFTHFQQILWGRKYNTLPIYKKKEGKWINI